MPGAACATAGKLNMRWLAAAAAELLAAAAGGAAIVLGCVRRSCAVGLSESGQTPGAASKMAAAVSAAGSPTATPPPCCTFTPAQCPASQPAPVATDAGGARGSSLLPVKSSSSCALLRPAASCTALLPPALCTMLPASISCRPSPATPPARQWPAEAPGGQSEVRADAAGPVSESGSCPNKPCPPTARPAAMLQQLASWMSGAKGGLAGRSLQ